MEENQVSATQNNMSQNPVVNGGVGSEGEKMSKKSIIGMTILTVVALAGLAFGIWGMSEKDRAEKDLAIKITEMSGKVTDITADKITSIDEDGTVTEITDTNVTADVVNPADYIYVGEWGLKIKIPEGLNVKDYAFNTEASAGDSVTRISVGLENGDYGEYYLGTVVRISKSSYDDGLEQPYEPAFSDDEYYYVVSHPNGDVPASLQSELELISDMLSNSENYSRI